MEVTTAHPAESNVARRSADDEITAAQAEPFDDFANPPVKDVYEQERAIQGEAHFHRLGWKRFTVVLIIDCIALGFLGLPSAFASLGMVLGQILNVVVCCISMYTAYIIGRVKLKYPHITHYTDMGHLLFGRWGGYVFTAMFTGLFVLNVGSHCLTGSVAFTTISESATCSVVFGVVSAIILLLLAVPPSFTDIALLGYVDFTSIIIALFITIIATGIQNKGGAKVTEAAQWSAWPREGLTFNEAFGALVSICFAYGYGGAMPSLMSEMHTPTHYMKSIYVFSFVEVVIYGLTGGLIYAFVGKEVGSPALVSAGPLIARIAFGVALPVIFISGSINATVICRFIHGQVYKNSVIRYINTKRGWATWLALVSGVVILAWIIAEAIPFFSSLLNIQASFFLSGLSFYIPPIMWFMLLKDGKWYEKKNLRAALINLAVFLFGLAVLGVGTYSSVLGVIQEFQKGLKRPFTCQRA